MRRVGVLVGLVLLAVAVGFVGTAAASDAPDPSEYDSILDGMEGNGTEESPYNVTTITELQAVQGDLSGNYTLGKDVDASKTKEWNAGDGFDPIGNSSEQFTGTFNGSGNAVSDLYINRSSEDDVGLFGYLGLGGKIESVGLQSVNIDGNARVGGLVGSNNGGAVNESYVTGNITIVDDGQRVGGLVGSNNGEVNESYATGNVTGDSDVGGLIGRNSNSGEVSKSYATGNVTSDDGQRVGGLVGDNNGGTVNESYATGNVTGFDLFVGGLVGRNSGGVSESYATGNVTGRASVSGLVGRNSNSGEVSESYATGNVTGDSDVGGLVGKNNGGTVGESYATGNVSGTERVGGLVGDDSGTVTKSYWDMNTTSQDSSAGDEIGLTTKEMKGDAAKKTGNMTDFDFSATWDVFDGLRDGAKKVSYPYLVSNQQEPEPGLETLEVRYAGGEGTEAEPLEIANWTHLDNVRKNLDANFTLFNELNESTDGYDNVVDTPTEGFDPIGDSTNSFTGTFDGNENTITGLTINRSGQSHVGLFGEINGEAVIKNVELASVDITGDSRVGGLVGYSGNDPNVIRNITASGSVIADGDAGGVIGTNHQEATITNVSANVTVTSTSGSVGGLVGWGQFATLSAIHAVGDVSGGDRTGGLVGDHDGTIERSYATGAVSDGDAQGGLVARLQSNGHINESYATGSVDGFEYVGGLVGQNVGTVSNASASGNVNGSANVGGLVGENQNEIATSFATGYVDNTGSAIGGLVGLNTSGTVVEAYWDTETTNQSTSAGDGTGLSTTQMTGTNATEANNMGALDFSSMWTATDSYPLLQWSVASLELTLTNDELTEGETTDATVTVTTVDDREIDATTTSSYTTDPTSVASVDADGTVSADSEGSTTITAELVSREDTFALSVLASGGGGGSGSSGSNSSGGSTPAEEPEDQDGETTDDVEEPINNGTSNESADGSEPEVPVETDDTNDIDDETPGFGILVGIVSLLGASLLLGRRTL